MNEFQIKELVRSLWKTRQLALLVSLEEERSVARAASANGLTQPAASKLLRDIETALGVRLFERHARGVTPTEYGEILIRHARLAISEIMLAHDEIAALKSGQAGRATLGTVTNPGTNFVPAAIAKLKRRFPDILIRVELDFSKPLVERLLQGQLDVVVGRILDPGNTHQLSFEPLSNEPHAVIASAQHPLAGRGEVSLEELAAQAWILPPPGSLVRDRLTAVFRKRGLPLPANLVETNSLPVITTLLRTTHMVVPLPIEAVQHYCESGALAVLLRDVGVEIGSFGIVTRRNHRLSPAAQVMLAALRETAARLYPQATEARARASAVTSLKIPRA